MPMAPKKIVPRKKTPRDLAPREEQIMSVVYRLGKASVTEVRAELSDPPSYSAVRTMLGQLERKGFVRRDRSAVAHIYEPVRSRKVAGRSAFHRLLETFFPHSPGAALAELIDESVGKLSAEDIARLEEAIRRARQGE
jgi:predicted transcriptional regulator